MKYLFSVLLLILSTQTFSQLIEIEARIPEQRIKKGHLKMGNPGPKGKELHVNSKYLTLSEKPIIPVIPHILF